jgi:hypothetical protein
MAQYRTGEDKRRDREAGSRSPLRPHLFRLAVDVLATLSPRFGEEMTIIARRKA